MGHRHSQAWNIALGQWFSALDHIGTTYGTFKYLPPWGSGINIFSRLQMIPMHRQFENLSGVSKIPSNSECCHSNDETFPDRVSLTLLRHDTDVAIPDTGL